MVHIVTTGLERFKMQLIKIPVYRDTDVNTNYVRE
jgi:hypothetical protein